MFGFPFLGYKLYDVQTDEMQWHLFIDDFTRGAGYVPFETNNIASGQWSPSSFSVGPSYRHGYVIGMYVSTFLSFWGRK